MLFPRPVLAVALVVAAIVEAHAGEQSGVTIAGPSHPPVTLTAPDLAGAQAIPLKAEFLTAHGARTASFEGPLLWVVLQKAGAIDPSKHREQVSQTITVTGRDGYRATLAVGEIAPEFEGKQVILAERMDGKPLDSEHLRIVVPLDKRGGRSVRDVVRIEISAPALNQ